MLTVLNIVDTASGMQMAEPHVEALSAEQLGNGPHSQHGSTNGKHSGGVFLDIGMLQYEKILMNITKFAAIYLTCLVGT